MRRRQLIEGQAQFSDKNFEPSALKREFKEIEKGLWPVESVYRLKNPGGLPEHPGLAALDRLSDIYDTDWAIIAGMDRGQPMKRRTQARTIFTVLAKGLPGSRSDDRTWRTEEVKAKGSERPELMIAGLRYIYFLLRIANIEDHSLEGIKAEIRAVNAEYQGIDAFCSESWGVWDMVKWVESMDIPIEVISPTYARQLSAFTELYNLVNEGHIKAPPSAVMGNSGQELVEEELGKFDHDADRRWFGSPEKKMKYGAQDDSVYSIGWTIFGGRYLDPDDFRARNEVPYWGTMIQPSNLLGRW
jgi:hypothetical protein